MKKNIYIIISLFLILISCEVEENLLIDQQGVVPVEKTYQNADDEGVMSFVSGVYTRVYGSPLDQFGSYNDVTSVISMRHYLERMSGELANYWLYTESAESAKPFRVYWAYNYGIIYSCNLIIKYLPDNTEASPEVIDRAIAEARAIRAIQMMYLVQFYGNPPLADHIMDGSEGNTPAETSWTFIETELTEVAEQLPSKSGVDTQNLIGGRLTKEAAYAYLGKAYLWQKKYSLSASILYNKVIATELYGLVEDINSLNSYKSNFCSENMWEYEIKDDPTYYTTQNGTLTPTFINWNTSTQYVPDGYYDGNGYGEYAYPSESFGVFMEEHDIVNGTQSDRFKATIASYEDMLDPNRFTYEEASGKGLIEATNLCEGYFRVKGIPLAENIRSGASFWYYDLPVNNLCFMRYAEVLLNYAEAVAMGGAEGALSGLEALNMVRNRAGLTDALSLDMDNEEYGVKAERRAELFYEGTRFVDLVRWGEGYSTLKDVGKVTPKFYGYNDGLNSVAQSKDEWKIEYTQTIGEGFKENKNELFPIPHVERSNNPNLTQNPGW